MEADNSQVEEQKTPDLNIQIKIKYGRRAACSQLVAGFVTAFIYFLRGFSFGMPTVIIGSLNERSASNETLQEYSHLILSPEESSWLGSVFYLLCLFGCLISGYFSEIIGRQKLLFLTTIPYFIGWLLIYFADSVVWVSIGVILLGLETGCVEPPILSYVGEISEPRLRGSLNSSLEAALNIGALSIYFIYALTDWRTTILICSIFPAIAILLTASVPESPTWLVSKGKISEAEKSLRWLRGWSIKEKVSVEFEQIVNSITKQSSNKSTENEKKIKVTEIFSRPEILKAFFMILILFSVCIVATLQPIKPFIVEIFRTLRIPIEAEWVLVLTGVLSIIGSIFSALTVHRFGKKNMALWCFALNFIATAGLGICAFNLHWPGWISLTLFCLNYFLANYGLIALPLMLISEVFPQEVRGVMSGFSAASAYIIVFLTIKTYINLEEWFGLHGTLFIYSSASVIGWIYTYLCVPETEGRTLDEVVRFFSEKQTVFEFQEMYKKKQQTNEEQKY